MSTSTMKEWNVWNVWISPNSTRVLTLGDPTVQPVLMMTCYLRGQCEQTIYELFFGMDLLPDDTYLAIRNISYQSGITPDDMLDILRTVDPHIALSANDLLAMTKRTSKSVYHAKKLEELRDNTNQS